MALRMKRIDERTYQIKDGTEHVAWCRLLDGKFWEATNMSSYGLGENPVIAFDKFADAYRKKRGASAAVKGRLVNPRVTHPSNRKDYKPRPVPIKERVDVDTAVVRITTQAITERMKALVAQPSTLPEVRFTIRHRVAQRNGDRHA